MLFPLRWYLFFLLLLATTFLILSLREIDSRFENDISRYVKDRTEDLRSPPELRKNKKYSSQQDHEAESVDSNKRIRNESPESHSNAWQTSDREDTVSANSSSSSSTTTSANNRFALPKVDQPYWNLECPLEMSMFSGIHMATPEYTNRAWAARDFANNAVSFFAQQDWSDMETRKIVFVGDSLLRQVFISMACLAWDRVDDYTIPWFQNRQVRQHQPNTVGKGPHSKFEEGRVLLRGNIELIYHHGIGGLLELGEEYHTEETETWIKACFLGKPFTGLVPKFIDWANVDAKGGDPRMLINTDNVERERLSFGSEDIVLINASVHGGRKFNLQNIQELMECRKTRGVDQNRKLKQQWPDFYYILTGPSHFPTKTGAFDKRLLDAEKDFECIQQSTYQDLQVEEKNKLNKYLPFIGSDIFKLQLDSGHLHVGGKDCLHWMQPGIPDLLAADVLRYVTARISHR
ncbi:GDSL/SGNH-like acyl-esterase family protein [Nitzschia inconspicua]|uniref:GDSL/SGNH-like acyl-esterase family protein n=1 Tax=Nitzschia inconspicua TaxID=303405 RepID=A0A9K3K8M0_9STRA|nr:GDSL/SGNH-like acyl-esterase family protein [Nitzschia inconspicua]KAG7367084.1 GDSL/SGNH-like acyl-esterase family protein [Nitzschia inconspicua]